MRRTRAELLCVFQIYLDKLEIYDEDRRDHLSVMFLNRELSRATERDFQTWQRTNKIAPATVLMRTRGSRLFAFSAWLNEFRPFADRIERERLTRLYLTRNLARDIQREFHQYMRKEVRHDGPTLS